MPLLAPDKAEDPSMKHKVIKQSDKPLDPNLWRLVCSMKAVLKRAYPNENERKLVAEKIMQQVNV